MNKNLNVNLKFIIMIIEMNY